MSTSKRGDILLRIYPAFFMVVMLGLAVIGKALHTQTVEGDYWRGIADSQSVVSRVIEADRGNIFASDGRLLATSIPYFELHIDFLSDAMSDEIFEKNVDSLALVLAAFKQDKSAEAYNMELRKARKKGNRYYLLAKKITYPQLKEMYQWPFLRLGKYKSGLIVLEKQTRSMPFGMLAMRTIGYANKESNKKVGLEAKYDKELTGKKGKMMMQRLAGGTYMPLNSDEEVTAAPGYDIHTNIDINFQDLAEASLMKALIANKADHGSMILMEVSTGKIRAMVNLGKTADSTYGEINNYAVTDAAEPGSTFKLASIICLLEEGYVDINDQVNLENGRKTFYGETLRDSHDPDSNVVSIKSAFAKSSNVAIAKLVTQYFGSDRKKFYNHLAGMHLTQKTGIDLEGEAPPVLKSPEHWSGLSMPWMSVGYEMQLTPLQVLTLYNAVANNGKMMRPYLVEKVSRYNKVIQQNDPQVLVEEICSKSTLSKVNQMLCAVVNYGTGTKVKSTRYSIAAKTGTAQMNIGGAYRKNYQASIVGFFPADKPLYSCIVVVNNPSNGQYYGGSVAGPVFKDIADKVYATQIENHDAINAIARRDSLMQKWASSFGGASFTEMQSILTAFGFQLKQTAHSNDDFVKPVFTGNAFQMHTLPNETGKLPDVKGMGLKDAVYMIESCGMRTEVLQSGVPGGKVKQQLPVAGSAISKGGTVKLVIG